MGLMKIRISEMLDNASEIIHGENHFEGMIESKKIKEIVFRKIAESRRKKNIRRFIAALIVALSVCGVSVAAKSILRSAGLIGTNTEQILTPQIGTKTEEGDGSNYIDNWELKINLISPENLYENGIPIAKYIEEISVDAEGNVPNCYLDNGAMLIFTKSSSVGWQVQENTALQLKFRQERVGQNDINSPGTLEIGYICEGEISWHQIVDDLVIDMEFPIYKGGEYCICLRNVSSDRITIMDGSIKEKTTEEE